MSHCLGGHGSSSSSLLLGLGGLSLNLGLLLLLLLDLLLGQSEFVGVILEFLVDILDCLLSRLLGGGLLHEGSVRLEHDLVVFSHKPLVLVSLVASLTSLLGLVQLALVSSTAEAHIEREFLLVSAARLVQLSTVGAHVGVHGRDLGLSESSLAGMKTGKIVLGFLISMGVLEGILCVGEGLVGCRGLIHLDGGILTIVNLGL